MSEALSQLMVALTGWLDLLGVCVAAIFTLAVLSYVLGDNPVFRLAEYLFVGVAAGYAASLAWGRVLLPRLQLLLSEPQTYWYYGIFFALGLCMLVRGIKPLSALANLPLALMVGAGAGLALGGALTGSLVPQVRATIVSVAPSHYGPGGTGWAQALDAALLAMGTIAVFSAFHYTVQGQGPLGNLGNRLLQGIGKVGRGLITLAFGVLLAGAALSFFTVLCSRVDFLFYDWALRIVNMGL
jgi:hypothetical protein